MNAYFTKFEFKIPNFYSNQNMTYYGCFAQCEEYLKCIYEQNPDEALKNLITMGQKGKQNLDIDNEDIEDDDEEDDGGQQNFLVT